MDLRNVDRLDATLEPMLRAARIPGAGITVVASGEMIFAKGYGYRDLQARLPLTPKTVYPIASTTKAITATLLGMLVDDGLLAWDAPVQDYLPRFRLSDAVISAQVTIRDLFAMRTGLPRHDWMWEGYPISRVELVDSLRHLERSAGFRERFQYNNVLITTAGHIAEVMTGKSWEDLIQERLLNPIGMCASGFMLPATGEVTSSYHENGRRELVVTQRLSGEVTGPSGGSMHSTIEDMARWALLNLSGGRAAERELIRSKTLSEIHAPQIVVGVDPVAPSPHAAYAMGWFVDTYNGRVRVAHGGYAHDVSSDVSLFPEDDMGIVSFSNFGCPIPARLINQYVFDLIQGLAPAQSFQDILAQYERRIAETRERNASARRVVGTSPSHALDDYAGVYTHPGYGKIEIQKNDDELIFQRHPRNSLVLPLQHWHYDVWVAKENEEFGLHAPNPFDAANRLLFATDVDGEISAVSIRLEPAVAPIRFEKQ